MNKKLYWFTPSVGKKEAKYVSEVINLNYPNQGHITKKLEKSISKLLNVRYAIATTSGTMSIYLALKALDVRKNDKVVVPNITFVATANAVEMTGAKVILVDIDKNNLGICIDSLKKIISKNKVKAIIPVHISGRNSNILEVVKFAKKRNIKIVEDAAEAFYSKNGNHFLGTVGDMGCFSFSPNKIITTGQGGMVITNNKKLYLLLLKLKDQGRVGKVTGGDDKHVCVGYNFKFTNILSAVGLAQLSQLKKRKKKMISIYKIYQKNLKTSKNFKLFPFNVENGELPLWTDAYSTKRNKLILKLEKKGIECRKFWKPLNLLNTYKKSFKYFPNSKFYLNKLFWLPSSFEMTKKDVLRVCNEINKANKF